MEEERQDGVPTAEVAVSETEPKSEPRCFPMEEMGERPDSTRSMLHLSEEFLVGELGALPDDDLAFQTLGPDFREPNVRCPFCHQGVLRLVNVRPKERRTERHRRSSKNQIGNSYLFGCPSCEAHFIGVLSWKETLPFDSGKER
jgi:hypothetical protein